MYMVGEYKRDINIIQNGTECIKKETKKGRKWNGSSTPSKCACQVKRKKDNKHDGLNIRATR